NGNSYTTEFRQYDSRIARWTSVDPLFANFPWQSPYVAFDNNPIVIIDPKGLAGENSNDRGGNKTNKATKKFEKKLNKWKKNHSDELKSLSAFEIEEVFKQTHRNKSWVSKYEK